MRVVLLGLEFHIGNRGCEALSYSFLEELNKIALEKNTKFDVTAIVFVMGDKPEVPQGICSIELVKISPKKMSFWKICSRIFKQGDLIVDFSMGDSFADIYGTKRFGIMTMLKEMAVRSKTPFVLGPQTYGPYSRRWVQKWAASIIKRSTAVYARDLLSKEYIKDLCDIDIKQTTDVAFALPYNKQASRGADNDRIKVGFNPSGLLWNGGYTRNNQFALTVDYQEYCKQVVEALKEAGKYDISLIAHVGVPEETSVENDFSACEELQKEYPELKIVKNVASASAIKGEIAQMDVFVGARMHATIGAFSSGVATIPFSYSRKFEGLYHSLQYPYVIEALHITTKEAVEKTVEYISDYEKLKQKVALSMVEVHKFQEQFREELLKILTTCESGEEK